ncbi:MAG: class I SAM-dependent methyltransferase [Bacteroidales bacterium]|nr:class I SAM-dependent methyltransferase [Bacteroidales bacterium]
MRKIVEKYVELPTKIRKPLWRLWHNLIIGFDKEKKEAFLNYGYAGEQDEFEHFELNKDDSKFKYSIQLYAHVARHHGFKGTDVLEVGSGRGGGASFLTRYFKPNSYTAMDINERTIEFCNSHHDADGLKFIRGEAEKLPFENEQFHAVVNVESARCYTDIPKFFDEVKRVLKPGGKFLFADMIKPDDFETIITDLKKTGLRIIETKNILPNVVEALKQDSEQRMNAINANVPKILRKSFYEFAGVEGTGRFNSFDSNKIGYWSVTLEKPLN